MNTSRTAFWLAARIPKLLVFPVTRPLLKRQYRRQLGLVPTIGLLAGDFSRFQRISDWTFSHQILARNRTTRTFHTSLRQSGDKSFRGDLAR